MNTLSNHLTYLPPEQQAIRDRCFHPTGTFIEFRKEEVEQSIPDRFEQQVRSYPDRLAIRDKTHELTYDQLNRSANRVAHAILSQSGRRDRPIATLFEQGAPAVLAILGVLKAGKSYVPLDSNHPRARLRYTLKDSQAALILTDNQNLHLAGELAHGTAQLVNLDAMDSNLPDENPDCPILPTSVASILYTSGSTGQPKGVIHTHRNILHMISAHTNMYHVGYEDRVSFLYSPAVIGAARDVFGALLNGAAVFPFNPKEDVA